MKISKALIGLCVLYTLCSCCERLTTTNVLYQSIRTKYAQPTPENPIPDDAKIAVAYSISQTGDLTAIVYNRTSDIMTIDQTMSFFVNSNGQSTSYYDPTVRSTSNTDMSSVTKGASVNLGSVAGALGIGGIVGQIANGINVSGSGTSGQATTNATYVSDQPRVSLAPKSNGAMSKVFKVIGIGKEYINHGSLILPNLTEQTSECRFSVCISYSFDNGETFNKLITNFYTDSKMIIPVEEYGKVNNAMRRLFMEKPDALSEPCWILVPNYNAYKERIGIERGILYDYQ